VSRCPREISLILSTLYTTSLLIIFKPGPRPDSALFENCATGISASQLECPIFLPGIFLLASDRAEKWLAEKWRPMNTRTLNINLENRLIESRSQRAKRTLDLAVAIPATVLLLPLFVAIAAWIKLDSRGPVFFLQERVGQFGRLFRIFKFRTMDVDAEKRGSLITIGADRRITRSGRRLRKYKLDELPQLFNVIKGEMSLVGPRPEVPRYVDLYTKDQRLILALRPGVTSPASIAFSDESELLARQDDPENFYRAQLMPAKILEDLSYAKRATVLSDCAMIAKTVFRIFG
jgi:lipopolysaccharide/colanic/teichoic acid biosynthesis glycosyltransferase